LQDLLKERKIKRERLEGIYHYLHGEAEIRKAQLQRRCEHIRAAKESKVEIDDTGVIRVLLVLIRHPDSKPADVVRHLYGYSPPIVLEQVNSVFTRYAIGEKGGPSIF
jgi:hypothetical protein